MRHILVCLFLFGLMPVRLSGQCTADAGNDTVVCLGMIGIDTIQIGGNPTASGGVMPYTYTWETSTVMGPDTLTASSFLDDTTVANPIILNVNPDEITFYLTIVDGTGNSCTDSIKIRFSRFIISLIDYFASINQGDTTQLASVVGGGISPLTYQWSPNYNLSDSSIVNTFAYPDTTTFYVSTITDSAGCQITGPDVFEVYVTFVGIDNKLNNGSDVTLYPNPTTGLVTVSGRAQQIIRITVYNVLGEMVHDGELAGQQVDLSYLPGGIYMLHIQWDKTTLSKKILKL